MAIATQVLLDDKKRYVVKFTGDIAEVATLLVDVSSLAVPCTRVKLVSLDYDILVGIAVELLWDATTDLRIIKLNGHQGHRCYEKIGGLPNNAGAGITGDVNVVVTGAGAYTVVAEFIKIAF